MNLGVQAIFVVMNSENMMSQAKFGKVVVSAEYALSMSFRTHRM